jgi:hypothetical protein
MFLEISRGSFLDGKGRNVGKQVARAGFAFAETT